MRTGIAAAMALLLTATPLAAADRVVQVPAGVVWLPTGILVGDGDEIASVAGTWTANPALGMAGPEGHLRYLAKPGYALPGAAEGALVGRVCGRPFLVGPGTRVPPGRPGLLYLAINDDVARHYGQGFADNRGMLTVAIRSRGEIGEQPCDATVPVS